MAAPHDEGSLFRLYPVAFAELPSPPFLYFTVYEDFSRIDHDLGIASHLDEIRELEGLSEPDEFISYQNFFLCLSHWVFISPLTRMFLRVN